MEKITPTEILLINSARPPAIAELQRTYIVYTSYNTHIYVIYKSIYTHKGHTHRTLLAKGACELVAFDKDEYSRRGVDAANGAMLRVV